MIRAHIVVIHKLAAYVLALTVFQIIGRKTNAYIVVFHKSSYYIRPIAWCLLDGFYW